MRRREEGPNPRDIDPRNASRDSAEEETPFFRSDSWPPSDHETDRLSPSSEPANNQHVGGGTRTPPRVMSANSLYGEDFIMTTRRSSHGNDADADELVASPSLFSPLSGDETTTPPSIQAPLQSTTPPPLINAENISFSSKNNRPPRIPNVSLRYSGSVSHHSAPQANPSRLNHSQQASGGGTAASGGASLPLRVPSITTTNVAKPNHQRGTSSGDGSIMSALTDYTYEGHYHSVSLQPQYSNQHPPRMRSSSWDVGGSTGHKRAGLELGGLPNTNNENEESEMDLNFPLSLQQPILTDALEEPLVPVTEPLSSVDSSSNNGVAIGTNVLTPPVAAAARSDTGPMGNTDKAAKVLSELTQFETEAETLIIAAIESMNNGKNAQGKDKDSPIFFPNLPAEAADRFVDDVTATEKSGHVTNDTSDGVSSNDAAKGVEQPKNRVGSKDLESFESTEISSSPHREHLKQASVRYQALQDWASRRSSASPVKESSSDGVYQGSSDRLYRTITVMKAAGRLKHPFTKEKLDKNDDFDREEKVSQDKDRPIPGDANSVGEDIETGPRKTSLNEKINASLHHSHQIWNKTLKKGRQDLDLFSEFLAPRKAHLRKYITTALLICSLCLGLAALFFYGLENPPTGYGDKRDPIYEEGSVSWWIVFVGVRHLLTFSLAKLTGLVLVDYLVLTSPRFVHLIGPRLSLLISQSAGWPSVCFWTGIFDLIFLFASSTKYKLPYHWLFWQNSIGMFNATNPASSIISNIIYRNILIALVLTGSLVTIKRWWMGMKLGARLYTRFNEQVTSAVEDISLVTELAIYSRYGTFSSASTKREPLDLRIFKECDKKSTDVPNEPNSSLPHGVNVTSSDVMMGLLDEWTEEPNEDDIVDTSNVTYGDILQIRQTFNSLGGSMPFSPAFGEAKTRRNCCEGSISLYKRLLQKHNDISTLCFDHISEVAWNDADKLDFAKAKKLYSTFHPNEEGKIELVDFVRGIDEIYKEITLLKRNVENAAAIHRAAEKLFDVGFYFALGFIILVMLQIDPIALILGLSSLVVSFSFCIGPAAANYFEGLLLILVRRPYDIGDRIAVSQVDQDTSVDGSTGWIVEKIDLYTTTVRLAATREIATVSNGSIARSRIINMKRSLQAQVALYLKFGIDTPFAKILVLKKAVDKFVRDRPREWLTLVAFRASIIQADLGYVQYNVVLQHVESWQNIGVILESKARLSSFCLELQKQLGIRYSAPPMPIDLTLQNQDEAAANVAVKTTSQGGGPAMEGTPQDIQSSQEIRTPQSLERNIQAIETMFESKKSR